jgi:hypothetical protein
MEMLYLRQRRIELGDGKKSSTHVDGHKEPSNMSTVLWLGRQPV